MKPAFVVFFVLVLSQHVLKSQVIFSTPSGLFQEQGGAVARLPTGFVEHNFAAVSRDSRFIVFSTPDGVAPPPAPQVPPSSDLYIFDRVFGRTRKVVDNQTGISGLDVLSNRPLSAVMSPNNQILAYGIEITRRQGLTNPQAGRNLIIASAATGAQIATPRLAAQGDSTGGEFVGISWDPSSAFFVTPVLSQIAGGQPLPAICRVGVNGAGQWVIGAPLNNNWGYSNGGSTLHTQIYPALSPSGAGLAYFQITFPSIISKVVVAQLVVANSDGSNAQVIWTFPQGQYPTGLAWTADGTRLVYGIGAQLQLPGGGVTTLVNPNATDVRQITISNLALNLVPGIGTRAAFAPSVPHGGMLARDLSRPGLKVRGGKRIRTRSKRAVIRGKARDNFAVARIDAKARGAKAKKPRLKSNGRFKVKLRLKKRRSIVLLTATDRAGFRSKKTKVRVIRR